MEHRPPIIIVLFTDDQGYADMSVNGCKDYETPHLGSLAQNGVRCASGYVTHSQCSPSRAGMMTGRHQSRFGHEENRPTPSIRSWACSYQKRLSRIILRQRATLPAISANGISAITSARCR